MLIVSRLNGIGVVQTQHVDSMFANYGGTEIRAALESMFRNRQQNVPTSCFVLTDGEVSIRICNTLQLFTHNS